MARMSDVFSLTDEQIEHVRPFFLENHTKPLVGD
jgi:hypothetical protein